MTECCSPRILGIASYKQGLELTQVDALQNGEFPGYQGSPNKNGPWKSTEVYSGVYKRAGEDRLTYNN